ncbi:MAG: hypothetical protein HY754_10650 [Nitrospirae bacterium]|nr:hypothetical protein [Nitrospirota bacterium]
MESNKWLIKGRIMRKLICHFIAIFLILFFPLLTFSSPIDQLQNNHLPGNKFLSDKDGNLYIFNQNNLYMKSNTLGDVWGKKVSDIRTASIDPTDSKIIYVVRTNGSIEKTVDGGKEWIKIDNGLPVKKGLIFVNPHDNREVFLTSGEGLYRSKDSGLSWDIVNLKEGVRIFFINPKNKSIFYALAEKGLYSSKDAGLTWSRIDNTLPHITLKEKGRTAKKVPLSVRAITYANYAKPFLMAIASDSEKNQLRLFKTENNGVSWSEAKCPEPAWEFDSIYVEDRAVFLGGRNVIYKSKDGVNWEKIDLAKNGINESVKSITKDKEGKGLLIATASGKTLRIDDNGNVIGGEKAEKPIPGDLVDTEPLYQICSSQYSSACGGGGIYSVVIDKDNNYTYIGQNDTKFNEPSDCSTYIFKLSSWEKAGVIPCKIQKGQAMKLTLSPDNRYIAVINKSGKIIVLEKDTWKIQYESPIENVKDVAFSPDGQFLAFADNYKIYILHITQWKEVKVLFYQDEIRIFTFSKDGKYLVVGSDFNPQKDRTNLYIYEALTWKEVYRDRSPDNDATSQISSMEFDNTGKLFFVRYLNGTIQAYDKTWTKKIVGNFGNFKYRYGSDEVAKLKIDTENNYLITWGTYKEDVRFTDLNTMHEVQSIKGLWPYTFNKYFLISSFSKDIGYSGVCPRGIEYLVAIDISHLTSFYLSRTLRNFGFKEQANILSVRSQEIETNFQNKLKAIQKERDDALAKLESTKKDEFETEVEYKNRIAQRDSKIKEINQTYEDSHLALRRERTNKRIELLDQYEKELDSLLLTTRKPIKGLTLSVKEYNADIETFPISFNENGAEFFSGYVKVLRDNAKNFKNNCDKFQVLGETQLDRTGRIKLVDTSIKDPETGKEYPVTNPPLWGCRFDENGRHMRYFKYLLIVLFLLAGLGCEKYPENYGIYVYANTDNGLLTLKSQKVSFVGNLFMSITGLKSASGTQCNSVKNFIVFEKDINPKSVRISKLEFKKGGYVDNPFGNTYVDVNLWTAAKHIDFDISPIEGKKDMYKLTPKEKLPEGFYAVHFGALENISTIEASIGNIAFDFVIGNSDDYQSYEIIKKRNEEKFKSEAETLLKAMNTYFNNKDYSKIKEIYRPDGRTFSDSEWQDFTKGLATWLNDAGKIKESKIVTSSVSEDSGTFEVQTVYEKKGQQNEKLVVRKIGQNYFITSLE